MTHRTLAGTFFFHASISQWKQRNSTAHNKTNIFHVGKRVKGCSEKDNAEDSVT